MKVGDRVKVEFSGNPKGSIPPLYCADPQGVVIKINQNGGIYVRHDQTKQVVMWEADYLTVI